MLPPISHAAAPRRSTFIVAVSLAALLAGCASTPAPTPTPTLTFTSEEEAFAAAEKTFEEYTDAANATDLSQPKSFDAVYSWLVGDALASARKNFSQLHAAGLTRVGATSFDTVTSVKTPSDSVALRLCLDVSSVELINADGSSAVPADRPPRQPIEVEFSPSHTSTSLAISSFIPAASYQCG